MTRADDATKLAQLGFRIFPLRPNSKIPPAGLHWKEAASSDPEKAFKLWSNGHADCNIGIRTGQGLVVLDFDAKPGQQGLESLAAMEALYDLPQSYRVQTPSGGVHVYLRTPSDVSIRNSAKRVVDFPDVDVRAEGGYVVGPGSILDVGGYLPLGGEIADAPPAILDLLGRSERHDAREMAGSVVVDLDQPDAIARAAKYLQQEAPASTEGDGGDDTAYRVACRVLDFGLSQDAALDAMHEHWNDRCSPPWSDRELRTKVRNAAAYRHEPIGSASPAADFEPVPQENAEPTPTGSVARFPLEQIAHLRQLPTPKWLVRNWLPENAVGILYGKWGSGKTFIAFDIALHLAYGFADWHGAALPEGGRDVLVLAREGHQGFLQRIEAFQRHHGLAEDTDRLHFMRAPITFMNKGDFEALQKALTASGKRFGLVIVDTVARVLPGADMATPENITLFMERCSRLGHALGATVIGVHHENKTGTIMGSTYFEASSDFVYQVARQDADGRSLSRGRITCTKMKDGPDQWWRDLRFAAVATAPQAGPLGGTDSLDALEALPEAAGGSLVLSSVVEPVSARRASSTTREPMDDAALEDAVLRMILEEGLDVSPHKQARKSGRYAPVVIGKLLGLKAGAAEELVERMTQGGRLVVENGRNGAKLVAGFV